MSDEDLRERIARAIYEEHTGDSLDEGCEVWPLHDDLADAVLAVLSESERVVAESANGDTAATSPNDDTSRLRVWDGARVARYDPDPPFAEHHATVDAARVAGEDDTAPTQVWEEPQDCDCHGPTKAKPTPTDEAIRAEAEKRFPDPEGVTLLAWVAAKRSAFTDGVRWAREQTAPTVAPDVGTLEQVLLTAWRGAEGGIIRHQAEAVAAADPRRSEAEVKAEALDEFRADLAGVHWGDVESNKARDDIWRWLKARAARLRDEADQ